jgi:hypothetical protein
MVFPPFLVVPQAVSFLESMPFVMVNRAVPVCVEGLKNMRVGFGKMALELIPADPVVPVGIHIREMGLVLGRVSQTVLVVLLMA